VRPFARAGAIAAGLIGALAAAPIDAVLAQSAPKAAAGFVVSELPIHLKVGSGVAERDGTLLFTDVGTGGVIRVDPGSNATVVATLPIGIDVMGAPTGPYKVAVQGDRLLVTQGWQDVNRSEGPQDHALLSIEPGGAIHVVSRAFWNPYDLARAGADWFVADSGKNALFLWSPGSPEPVEYFVFPRVRHTASASQTLSPTEFPSGQPYDVDAVPTGVAVGKGVIYVALFGGFPFPDGGGQVVSLPIAASDRQARVEAGDLNAPTDVAVDGDGRLLVLEYGRFEVGGDFAPGSGRLLRIDLATGERTVLLSGLTKPATVLPLSAGDYVVTQMGGPVLRLTPK
jgi:hypothetical protein